MITHAIDKKDKSSTTTFVPAQLQMANNRAVQLQDNRGQSVIQRMQAEATQKKINQESYPVAQLARNKTARETIGGGIGLGITGAIIGSQVPVVGTVIGGLTGLTIGLVGGYWHSRPKIYPNLQNKDYQNELRIYKDYKKENEDSQSAYTRGTIIKYSRSNDRKFTKLLHMGQVLYTYDENSQLSIGSNAGPIKHAIVSGNKKVKAAGMAFVSFSQAQNNFGAYQDTFEKSEKARSLKDKVEQKALKIMRRLKVQTAGEALTKELNEVDREIVDNYFQSQNQLEHYLGELRKLSRLERKEPVVSKNNTVQIDNNSGHYHPENKSKDEALEGWHDAGFKNLRWKQFGKH
jgi:hypothetical protein